MYECVFIFPANVHLQEYISDSFHMTALRYARVNVERCSRIYESLALDNTCGTENKTKSFV